jgi:acyl carrier protein
MSVSANDLDAVAELISATWPDRLEGVILQQELELGEGGLGLDSVDAFELLVACEERWGRPMTEDLLKSDPLTVGLVVEHFAAA